jgi:HAD superfamily hydrolase (TIGR01484 family)
MKKLLAFDLDDTLAISKSAISNEIKQLLEKLSVDYMICVITGGTYNQIKTQVIDNLELSEEQKLQFHLMPTCGTRYVRYDSASKEWSEVYAEDLTENEKSEALEVLESVAKEFGLWVDKPYGKILEDRGSQITYSALGQEAPPEKKYQWKEENSEKKLLVKNEVAKLLPNLEVRLGGSTSIDITKPGIDKAYGIQKLIEQTGLEKFEILFFGDNLQEGGNDYPVKAFGIDSVSVDGWEETAEKLSNLDQIIAKYK